MVEQEVKGNEIKIASRDIRIYIGQCALDFQKFDQIILSAGDSFVEKMLYIANILRAVGIDVDKNYKNKTTGKPQLKTEPTEILNERTGRRETKKFHKLGLTKIPELFMYTDPEAAVELPELDNEEEAKNNSQNSKRKTRRKN